MTGLAEMVTKIEHVSSFRSARKPISKNRETLPDPHYPSCILVSAQEEQINSSEGVVY